MKSIKLFDVELTVDDFCEVYDDNSWMDSINIPKEMQSDLLRHLMCFHFVDLSEAYPGHVVKVKLVEPKDYEGGYYEED